jgi:hypothetical protein
MIRWRNSDYYTPKEAAEKLHLSPRTVLRRLKKYVVNMNPEGKRQTPRIPKSAIDEFLKIKK